MFSDTSKTNASHPINEGGKGYEGVVTGPATHDGVCYQPSDPKVSRAAADHVRHVDAVGFKGPRMETLLVRAGRFGVLCHAQRVCCVSKTPRGDV